MGDGWKWFGIVRGGLYQEIEPSCFTTKSWFSLLSVGFHLHMLFYLNSQIGESLLLWFAG
jgi:hypothetical protein